jgi:hypothetical protein
VRATIALPSMLACAFSLYAQITTTLNHLPDGSDEVRIQNKSQVDLVAFVVTVQQAPWRGRIDHAPLVAYSDPLIDLAVRPLLANEERVVFRMGGIPLDSTGKPLLPNRAGTSHVLEEPISAAGVFSDGTTTGDAALLTRLIFRRSNMLFAVETALETLSNAGRRNQPKDQLVGQFRKMADSLDRGYLPPEQRIGRNLYISIAEKLSALPDPQLGSPFPPTTFIDHETAPLRQQRVALLESQPSLIDATPIERGMPPQRALQATPPPISVKHE